MAKNIVFSGDHREISTFTTTLHDCSKVSGFVYSTFKNLADSSLIKLFDLFGKILILDFTHVRKIRPHVLATLYALVLEDWNIFICGPFPGGRNVPVSPELHTLEKAKLQRLEFSRAGIDLHRRILTVPFGGVPQIANSDIQILTELEFHFGWSFRTTETNYFSFV